MPGPRRCPRPGRHPLNACPIGLLFLALGSAACGDDAATSGAGGDGGGGGAASSSSTGGGPVGPDGPVIVGGDERPVEVFVPSTYVHGTPLPLVVMLHGYSASSVLQDAYFGLEPLAEELGFLYAHPDGLFDEEGKRFWNATDACCDFHDDGVDDSAYLRGVVDAIAAELTVDPRRIHFMGHSNGGFMSYRMACDHAEMVASIASLAGATFSDPSACSPSEPVAALQIHGTLDETVLYEGAAILGGPAHPGALETAEIWAAYGGCATEPSELPARDLLSSPDGDDSQVLGWGGCDAGGGAELWTMEGGTHIPVISPTFTRQLVEWLLAHPKP